MYNLILKIAKNDVRIKAVYMNGSRHMALQGHPAGTHGGRDGRHPRLREKPQRSFTDGQQTQWAFPKKLEEPVWGIPD